MENTKKDNFTKDDVLLDVYVAKLPKGETSARLYPPERDEEVNACKNDKVKGQKYYVWKLLEYALEKSFQYKLTDLEFIKDERGKWTSPTCFFSLSHSGNALAVAVSNGVVGVDVERLSSHKNAFIQKVLTDEEREAFTGVSAEKQTEYLIGKWTEKESVFKTLNELRFIPQKIDTTKHAVTSKRIEIDGEEYMLAFAAKKPFSLRYFVERNGEFSL